MSGSRVYHDGRFVDVSQVAVGPWDAGLTLGDGLFETLLVIDGGAVDVAAHLERLEAGLQALDLEIPESPEELEGIIRRLAADSRSCARLRVTITRGAPGGAPTRIVASRPYVPMEPSVRARGVTATVLTDLPVASAGPLRAIKSTSYQAELLGSRRARARGAFDGLLVNERGHIVEATRANVIVERDGELTTPPLADGCLPGTVRRRLLEAGAVREQPIPVADLGGLDGMALTGSLMGVVPVCAVDDRRLEPGQWWRELEAAWRRWW